MIEQDSERATVVVVGDDELVSLLDAHLPDRIGSADVVAAPNGMAALEELADRGRVDCFVSRQSLAESDGLGLLARVRDRNTRVPFVLAPARDDPDVAAAAASAEVDGYVPTDTASAGVSLALTVEQAVGSVRTGRALSTLQSRHETVVDTIPGGTFTVDGNGEFVDASPRTRYLLGVEGATLRGRAVTDSAWSVTTVDGDPMPPEDIPVIETIRTGEPVRQCRCGFIAPDGSRRYVSLSTRPVFVDGELSEVVGSIVDITENVEREQRIEEARSRLRALFDEAPDPVFVHDTSGRIVDAGEQAIEAFGYDREELRDLSIWDLTTSSDRSVLFDLFDELPTDGSARVDAHYQSADGTEVPVEVTLSRFTVDDETRVVAHVRDVSERRRVRERLRENERALRTLYEVIADTERDFDEKLAEILRVGCQRLDLPFGFLTDIEDGRQSIVEARGSHELLQPGESTPLEQSYCRKTITEDGLLGVVDALEEGWAEDPAYETFELGCYLGGAVKVGDETRGTLCFAGDAARETPFSSAERTFVELLVKWVGYELERRERAAELERQRDLFSRAEEIADVGAWEYDAETDEVFWTEQTRRIHGCSPEYDPTLSEAFEFFHPEDRDRLREAFDHALAECEPYDIEVRILTAADETRWVRTRGEPACGGDCDGCDDEAQHLRGTIQDVTGRKRRRRELRSYEEMVNTVGDPMYQLDADGRYVMVNDAWVDAIGYEREEILGTHASDMMVDERDAEDTQRAIAEAVASESADLITREFEVERADGHRFPVESRIRSFFEDGEFRGTVGVSRDITERERYETMLTDLHDVTWEFLDATTADEITETMLDGVRDVLGLDRAAILIHDESAGGLEPVVWTENLAEPMAQGPDIWGDGTTAWRSYQRGVVLSCDATEIACDAFAGVATTCSFVPLGQRGVLLLCDADEAAIGTDVSELVETLAATAETAFGRVERERKLRERERELREQKAFADGLIDSLPDMMYALGIDGEFTRWNDHLLEATGYDETAVSNMDPLELIVPADRPAAAEAIDAVYDGAIRRLEARVETATGDSVPHEFTGAPIREDGEVVGLVGTGRDISRRIEHQQTLKTLHETTQDLLRAGTEAEIGRIAVQAAEQVLDFEAVALWSFDETENELVPVAHTEQTEQLLGGGPPTFRPGNSIAWEVFVTGEGRVYDDVRQDTDVHDESTPFRAEVIIPLGERGLICAGNTTADAPDGDVLDLFEILAANCEAALERQHRERTLRERDRELQAQNERLEQVETINQQIRNVGHALVGAESREGIEQAVCEHLVDTDRFAFAWVAGVDPVDDALVPRAWAGSERGYLDEVSTTFEDAEPAAVAAREKEPVVVDAVAQDLRSAPWRQSALSRDFLSATAVPLTYDGVLYGVLAVYGTRPNAFDDPVGTVIEEFGATVAHALNAVERKRALLADSFVELEFEVPTGTTPLFSLVERLDCRLSLDTVLPESDGTMLVYATVDADEAAVEAAAKDVLALDGYRSIRSTDGETQVELRLRGESLPTIVADHGGSVERVLLSGGDGRVVLSVPETTDVRSFVHMFTARFEGAELFARRRQTFEHTAEASLGSQLSSLTPRQRDVITAAYFSGFFEWPRQSTGEEVAESLGISPPTFQEHLRRAEAKLLAELVDSSALPKPTDG